MQNGEDATNEQASQSNRSDGNDSEELMLDANDGINGTADKTNNLVPRFKKRSNIQIDIPSVTRG